jgi:DNA-binding NarL/FixJ family response regulator
MTNPIRILIVDDNAAVRSDLQLVLELEGGIEVVGIATNGREAILKAKDLRPEIVLMDLEMPDLDGYQATKVIKSEAQAPAVLVLTVHGYAAAMQAANRAGADAFFVKGQDLKAMLEKIHHTARHP